MAIFFSPPIRIRIGLRAHKYPTFYNSTRQRGNLKWPASLFLVVNLARFILVESEGEAW